MPGRGEADNRGAAGYEGVGSANGRDLGGGVGQYLFHRPAATNETGRHDVAPSFEKARRRKYRFGTAGCDTPAAHFCVVPAQTIGPETVPRLAATHFAAFVAL
jgi:hypothetical protein